jgi:hypothetical protein
MKPQQQQQQQQQQWQQWQQQQRCGMHMGIGNEGGAPIHTANGMVRVRVQCLDQGLKGGSSKQAQGMGHVTHCRFVPPNAPDFSTISDIEFRLINRLATVACFDAIVLNSSSVDKPPGALVPTCTP